MAEELDVAVIKKTQDILGSVIKKPPLTDKSLKKPPFRFLHDIITNVIKTSGFMKGLYSSEELQSENVKDKEGKIAFLQKAIDVLELVINQQLSVKPTKIVAGHEPQKTNEFLQALGNAVKNKLDSKEAVSKVLSEKAPKRTNKDRKASLDKKAVTSQRGPDKSSRFANKPADASKKISSSRDDKAKTRDDKERSHTKIKENKQKEREKSKDRTRKRDDSKVREKDSTKDTQKRPSKEKKKPQPDKPEVLSPIKNVHENGTNNLENANDILSPEKETNEEPSGVLLNGDVLQNEQNEEPAVELKPEPEPEPEKPSETVVEKEKSAKKEKTRRPPSAHAPRTPSARLVKAFPVEDSGPLEGTSSSNVNKEVPVLNTEAPPPLRPFTPSRPPSARPPSARPAPPKIRIRHIVENEEARPPSAKPVENVILDNKPPSDDEDDADFVVAEEKPKDEAASEMVVPSVPVAETPEEDQGSLVRQLLETKKDLEGGSQQPLSRKVEIDKSQMLDAARRRERDSSGKELEQLRHFIQTVSRTANPLGRMLDYLQEDIDAMKAELQMWREENRQNLMALRREQSVTESILEPLRVQLDDLDMQVQDQLETNSMLKSTIFRNDERIQRMLTAINNRS